MKEVVKKEIIKLIDAGIIYPISASTWVSPMQVVPKKGRICDVTCWKITGSNFPSNKYFSGLEYNFPDPIKLFRVVFYLVGP